MTEVRAKSWESTTSLPKAGRSIKAAALWTVLVVSASLLASAGHLSPLSKTDPALAGMAAAHPRSHVSVIVRKTNPDSRDAERRVWALGGQVTRDLSIIGSFAARLPGGALAALADSTAVSRLWGDAHLRATSYDLSQYDSYAPDTSWHQTIDSATSGSTTNGGAGVTVALLDTGITQVPDLGNRVLARVDFTPDHDGLDRYGHGTHMAGIIAGDGTSSNGQWVGIAPKADLVSVKVARGDGSTDVSVVIAAMQWIVSHRAEYKIRVLNVSYGTDSRQSYLIDPLDFAVERVWRSGIFVVVAAGNRGPDSGTISKPGDDPFVVTVGAMDTKNTTNRYDDEVAPFSARGPTQDGLTKPDLMAPGISIVSNRAPGSTIDLEHPNARLGESYFKGTGTSQAAAAVSGVAALAFAASPGLSPDLAKAVLLRTTDRRFLLRRDGSRLGIVDLDALFALLSRGFIGISPANQGVASSSGLGSLEASRGSSHVLADIDGDGQLDLVKGEMTTLGTPWSPENFILGNSWTASSWLGNEWSCYVFEGNEWAGNEWSGNEWSGNEWAGNEWSGKEWSGNSWS